MKEHELKQNFQDQLERCVELSDALNAELQLLQYLADRGYYTPDQSRVLNLCIESYSNTTGIIAKLNEIKMNEDRHSSTAIA